MHAAAAVCREAATSYFYHSFFGPGRKSRPNWELELYEAGISGALVTDNHQVSSHSAAVPGGEKNTCPKSSSDESVAGLDI